MPEYCSCGAQLVDGALFCHKCGKPTRETAEPPVEETAPAAPIAEPPRTPPDFSVVSFHNPLAVRTGFLIAAAYMFVFMLLQLIPTLALLGFLILLPAAGFAAAYLYSRRSGLQLSVRAGARMGWITGIFGFTISTVMNTMSIIAVSSTGELAETLKKNFAQSTADPEVQKQFAKIVETPSILLFALLLGFFCWFLMFTILPTIGGALGAKVMEKD